jgi:general secretion pathway protein I
MTRAACKSTQHGFSLLEVLIALVISGLALASAFQAASESMRATTTARRYQEAVARAQSRLDALGANLAVGEQQGDDGGGFHWRTLIRPIDSTTKRDDHDRPAVNRDTLVVTLYAASVWISWEENKRSRSVRLDSARLMSSAPS